MQIIIIIIDNNKVTTLAHWGRTLARLTDHLSKPETAYEI